MLGSGPNMHYGHVIFNIFAHRWNMDLQMDFFSFFFSTHLALTTPLNTAQSGTILHCVVLYCIVMYHTVGSKQLG